MAVVHPNRTPEKSGGDKAGKTLTPATAQYNIMAEPAEPSRKRTVQCMMNIKHGGE
jgi:hypothetical protein